ncbi:WxL protein peptidoglycan domain-containing protein [Streptomyces polyrhachis]|uniref:WxL protein peptidoglycan domain-containing protein n=1 Tax=Streptomyces polyrhachis TaxID=1282885 RepID=A0ABW2GED9_9ACTN
MHEGSAPASHVRLAVSLLLSLALCLLAAVSLSGPAQAADNGHWSIFPAHAKGEQPGKITDFRLTADQGQVFQEKIAILNHTDAPKTFLVYAADAYNTARDGGLAVKDMEEKQKGVGSWIELKRTKVTVAPKKEVEIPFTLTVPARAEPGDHVGAVLAMDEKTSKSETDSSVKVRRSVGTRVYVSVAGTRTTELSLENVRFDYDPPLIPGTGEPATIRYTLVNSGNVMIKPLMDLKSKGFLGRSALSLDDRQLPTELLPGQRVDIVQEWKSPPFLDFGDIEVIAGDAEGEQVKTVTLSYSTTNWISVTLLVVLLVLAVVGIFLYRRRQSATGDGEDESEDSRVPETV